MMRSLYSAISGLKNHQTKMDVIGNNIANVNTSGFKRSRTDFSTMLSQTIKGAATPGQNQGGTNAIQVGMGAMLGTTSQIMSQGSSQTTGQVTDLMLQGSGYFVMKNGAQTVYTRAGGFSFDSKGNLEDPASGALVQGYTWPADDSVDPSWAGTGYGNIKFKLGDQLILDNALVNKLNNMDTATFTGVVTGNQVWDNTYPCYTNETFKGAASLTITFADSTTATANTTPPLVANSFDSATGRVSFETTRTPQSIVPNFNLPSTDLVGTSPFDTKITDAQNFTVEDLSGAITPAADAASVGANDYYFDSTTGVLTLGSSLSPSDLTFTYTKDSINVPAPLDPAPYTFTDPDNLVGAGNLKIEGMTEISIGRTPEVGEFSFDPTSGTITFAQGFDPSVSKPVLTYAKALSLTGADGNKRTFDVDYLPTPGTPVYVDGEKYTLGTAGELDSTKNEYSVDVVGGKYQITLSNAPAAGAHKIGFDFVEQPHTLSSFSIDQTGVITGVYSDGVSSLTRKIAQAAVAKFPNDQGLQNIGGNFYLESNNSGQVDIGAAGENGRATIIPSALEMSNVDLAQEFTDMIVTQRGFQANSRVITVSDSLLQELIDLKRN